MLTTVNFLSTANPVYTVMNGTATFRYSATTWRRFAVYLHGSTLHGQVSRIINLIQSVHWLELRRRCICWLESSLTTTTYPPNFSLHACVQSMRFQTWLRGCPHTRTHTHTHTQFRPCGVATVLDEKAPTKREKQPKFLSLKCQTPSKTQTNKQSDKRTDASNRSGCILA